MRNLLLTFFLSSIFAYSAWAATENDTLISKQIVKQKIVEQGGSGLFKAIAVIPKSLPDFTVYRPQNMEWAYVREQKMPVLVFGNGGCSDTSIEYEKMLTDIASHGYVVVAVGPLQIVNNDRKVLHTESSALTVAINWILAQSKDKNSDFYQYIDTAKIAAAGHSCGGAQVLSICADKRIKTCLILNAGMGDMTMAGASHASLANLHTPIVYITGGPSDVAYNNARLDYERISNVPVAWADLPTAGHGGTYAHHFGGDYSRMVLDWMDWQFKGEKSNASIFINGDVSKYKGWIIKSKQFKSHIGKLINTEMPCTLLQGVDHRKYAIYLPGGYEESNQDYPVLYLLHGGGGSHTDWQHFARLREVTDSLADCGAIKDMIIVAPEGNEYNMMWFNAPQWNYEDFFFKEFIPYIERTYRIAKGREHRAVGGYSMGGGAAVVYGVHHPEMFSSVYDMSGYLRRQPLDFLKNDPKGEWRQRAVEANNPIKAILKMKDVEALKQVKWMIDCGDQDFTLDANMDFVKALRLKKIPYQMTVVSGNHNWNYWRRAMRDALCKSFVN